MLSRGSKFSIWTDVSGRWTESSCLATGKKYTKRTWDDKGKDVMERVLDFSRILLSDRTG
jgi:hypothetical protein